MPRDLRSLPEAVLERLNLDDPQPGIDLVTTYRGREFRVEERRAPVEIRATEDGAPIIEGYASTTGVSYPVFGGPPYGWNETIARGAFDAALERGDDTRLLINHDGLPLARTRSGTLALEEDGIGLHVLTPRGVDTANPRAQELVSAMSRSDVDEMSFAFTVDTNEDGDRMESWNEDYTERTIRGVRLFDVAVVTYPANPATAAVLRSSVSPVQRGMPALLARAYAELERF